VVERLPSDQRYIEPAVREDLARKMVFITGPRQVGKTTLAKHLLGRSQKGYLSWDLPEHREQILRQRLPVSPLWVFDEIHKYRAWRDLIKGLYDTKERDQKIIVTGSARLDFYRHGGDSLQGRYHLWRLHGLSVAELGLSKHSELLDLMRLGNFPEPYFSASEREARRWSREYRSRLVREDVASLERVQDLGTLELLALRMPDLVGSPLSLNALREDLQVSHKTVARWVAILERLYAVFRLAPFGAAKLRAVKKEQKHYHYDWTLVESPGARFENLVALHLLKWVCFHEDHDGRDLELRYFRDIDSREVDFVVTEKRKPILAVECKTGDELASAHLRYFKARFPSCVAWQVALNGKKDFTTPEGIRVAPAMTLLRTLV
jgi:predicted AAA+ superfamily ATPase